ncbi:MAG: acetyl-CoA carboxylase, carboxyltransferase subunit beta [Planctomycetota bacterium]|jgi:acetyl-CoA carboxylase carboxyl transferase subunit beta|nr:acetyl-CoA carboxylase, carboxyltransferase subunit beta [Planctomycetota bacterium]
MNRKKTVKKKDMPVGLWMRCKGCDSMIYKKVVEQKLNVCPECNYHFAISARDRIRLLVDEGTFEELHTELAPRDPLGFPDYPAKLEKAQKGTQLRDGVIVGLGELSGHQIAFGVTEPSFMMGSMGSVVGEKLTLIAEEALNRSLPLIIVSGSGGGARMQEGILSLFQMAKTSAALGRLDRAGGLYISVLTNATMGGAMASFASLGDIAIAEPKALLGFAGPRVVQNTIKKDLPEGFQTSEFLLEHGMIDLISEREKLKDTLAGVLDFCGSVRDRSTIRVRREDIDERRSADPEPD